MYDAKLSLALAKALSVATPMVGSIRPVDRHVFKDLLFQLPDLGQRDWNELASLIDQIPQLDTEEMLQDLRSILALPDQRPIVCYALERVFAGVPRVSLNEDVIERALDALIYEPTPGSLCHLGALVEDALMMRLSCEHGQPEDLAELRKIVHARTGIFLANDVASRLSEAKMNRLCLEATLIALVAHADGKVDDPELHVCRNFLCRMWSLPLREADFVLNLSLADRFDAMDVLRVCRWLYELTTRQERLRFLELLFDLAAVDNDLSDKEVETLMQIAANLRIEQEHFHDLFLSHGGVETLPPPVEVSRAGSW